MSLPMFSVKEIYDEEMYKQDLSIARLYSFETTGAVLLFSGNRDFSNALRKDHRVAQKKYNSIQQTRGGMILNHLNFYERMDTSYDVEIPDLAWRLASTQFINSIKGPVQTRICGATPKSVFRTLEMLLIINNKNITTINDVPREQFSKFMDEKYFALIERGYDSKTAFMHASSALYRKIAIAELRQSFQEARAENDNDLYSDALCRLDELKWQHKMDMCEVYTKSFMEGP